MKDNSDIPFWGKQKPLRHYFHGGVAKFSVRLNELFCTIVLINKRGNYPLDVMKVNDKEHLDKILAIKRIEEI